MPKPIAQLIKRLQGVVLDQTRACEELTAEQRRLRVAARVAALPPRHLAALQRLADAMQAARRGGAPNSPGASGGGSNGDARPRPQPQPPALRVPSVTSSGSTGGGAPPLLEPVGAADPRSSGSATGGSSTAAPGSPWPAGEETLLAAADAALFGEPGPDGGAGDLHWCPDEAMAWLASGEAPELSCAGFRKALQELGIASACLLP
jgi:hypothetical protein